MKAYTFLALLCCQSSLFAVGTLFECEGRLEQSYTASKKIQTSHGIKTKHLHNNMTKASIAATPMPHFEVGVELDACQTQMNSWGFDALKARAQYQWLNDLENDPVSLLTELSLSLSPDVRIRDLSSQNHGRREAGFAVTVAKEFGYRHESFWQTTLTGYVGAATTGAPWFGGKLLLEHAFSKDQKAGLFVLGEKGTSSHRLDRLHRFQSWSQVGYEFEEVGVEYSYRLFGWGALHLLGSKRMHARYAPTGTWQVQLAVTIPFALL